MSEHAWTQENIAAFVAGGLDAAESERLEEHAAACAECAAALRSARSLDDGLDGLFADRRPGPALEDRMIRSLRADSARAVLQLRWRHRLAWGAAAAVALGLTGAGMSQLVAEAKLPFPGMARQDAFPEQDSARVSLPVHGLFRGSWAGTEKPVATGQLVPDETSSMRDPDEMARQIAEQTPADGDGRPTHGSSKGMARDRHQASGGMTLGTSNMSDPSNPSKKEVPRQEPGQTDQPAPSEEHFKPDEGFSKQQQPGESKAGGEGKGDPKSVPEPAPDKVKPSEPPAPPKPEQPAPESPAARKVIRSGDIEFEIESFDSAFATVSKLVIGIKGAFVATVNSDKLANGKVKGTIVVRVPPDNLDPLVLDLRKELGKGGELKGQRIKSEDITKQYTDLESRLKAARTMEQRLLQIIKEGKGEIKQLLEAEKELGVWRTRIEELEGEIRYYSNLVALSTLTITLTEKEIRAAADVVESERVQAGIEVEDVDKSYREALAAVAEAKGRVTKSEVKQHSAGQFAAVLQFEVAPESAGPLRDRLRQLGNMVRLEIDRVQQPEGGTAPPPRDARVRRGETRFDVQLYNLAKVAPRETAVVQVAVDDVPVGYRVLRQAIEKAGGRVVTAQLNEQDRQNVTGQLDFEVTRAKEQALQEALTAAGEVLSRNVTRAVESANMTDAKVLFKVSLIAASKVPPRETVTLAIEVADVDAAVARFAEQVTRAHGRTVDSQVAHERSGRVTGHLIYDVPLSHAGGPIEQFKGAGTVRVHTTSRNLQAPEGPLALARLDVTLSNSELIVPHDDGLWPQVRTGLSYSVKVLSLSVTWLIFGLCVLLPWALVGYGGYRLVRRLFRAPPPVAPPPPAPPPAAVAP
jgi:hypothetical protein